MKGHYICIFGTKNVNGVEFFQVKDSNYGSEESIPVKRTSFDEEFLNGNKRFLPDIPHIHSGYTVELIKKNNR